MNDTPVITQTLIDEEKELLYKLLRGLEKITKNSKKNKDGVITDEL